MRGNESGAVELGEQAVALAEAIPHPWWVPATRTMLAATLLARAEPDAALSFLRPAALTAEGWLAQEGLTVAVRAQATLSAELATEASELLAAVDAPAGQGWLYGVDAYLATARTWWALGEAGRVRDVLRPLLAAARQAHWVPGSAEATELDAQAAAALGDTVADADTVSNTDAFA